MSDMGINIICPILILSGKPEIIFAMTASCFRDLVLKIYSTLDGSFTPTDRLSTFACKGKNADRQDRSICRKGVLQKVKNKIVLIFRSKQSTTFTFQIKDTSFWDKISHLLIKYSQ